MRFLLFLALLQPSYPPLSEYLMPRDAELALARSAAPATITAHATIKVLTKSGYAVAENGDNGFVCLVLRGWSAPTFAPAQFRALVYDPKIRMQDKNPDEIAATVKTAYDTGTLPKMEQVAFAYMFSANMYLAPGIGAFHPHVMVFTPFYENAMLGGNTFGGPAPFVSDDPGTPFTVTVIPVDHALAVEAH